MSGPPRIRRVATLDGAAGAPGAALTAAVEPALEEAARAAGREPTLLSLVLDRPGRAAPDSIVVEAWVERATRTLVFAAAEARAADGTLVGAASAVFRAG